MNSQYFHRIQLNLVNKRFCSAFDNKIYVTLPPSRVAEPARLGTTPASAPEILNKLAPAPKIFFIKCSVSEEF